MIDQTEIEDAAASVSQHSVGIALVALAGVFWSFGGVIVRMIDTQNPWQILVYRSLFVVLTLLICIGVREHARGSSVLASMRRAGLPAVVAGVGVAVAFIGFIVALVHTSVANAFFLIATQPFLVAIIAWFTLREACDRVTLVAGVLTFAGVAVMVNDSLGGTSFIGTLAALSSALGFSVFTVALRWGRGADMLPAMLYGGGFAAAVASIVLLLSGGEFLISASDFGWCAALGVTQIGLGTLAYIAGSRWVPASELALLSMTEIVLGPVWAWLFVNEFPARATLIGGAIILAALTWLSIVRICQARRLTRCVPVVDAKL